MYFHENTIFIKFTNIGNRLGTEVGLQFTIKSQTTFYCPCVKTKFQHINPSKLSQLNSEKPLRGQWPFFQIILRCLSHHFDVYFDVRWNTIKLSSIENRATEIYTHIQTEKSIDVTHTTRVLFANNFIFSDAHVKIENF